MPQRRRDPAGLESRPRGRRHRRRTRHVTVGHQPRRAAVEAGQAEPALQRRGQRVLAVGGVVSVVGVGHRHLQELVHGVRADGRVDPHRPAGGVGHVPVVADRLLHLVADDEPGGLLRRRPGPDADRRIGLTEHPHEPLGAGTEHGQGRLVAGRLRLHEVVGSLSVPVLDQGRPEPLHPGEVVHDVAHGPARTELDVGVEVSGRRLGETAAVVGDGSGTLLLAQWHTATVGPDPDDGRQTAATRATASSASSTRWMDRPISPRSRAIARNNGQTGNVSTQWSTPTRTRGGRVSPSTA